MLVDKIAVVSIFLLLISFMVDLLCGANFEKINRHNCIAAVLKYIHFWLPLIAMVLFLVVVILDS